MNRANFVLLQPGERVRLGRSRLTVLGRRYVQYVPYSSKGEFIVSFTPDDDNYVRDIGELDKEVPRLYKLEVPNE